MVNHWAEKPDSDGVNTKSDQPRLHVPDAPFRPGDTPWFGKFTEQPGDLSRPPLHTPSDDMHDHAYGLIRVLDDDGVAKGKWNPYLPTETIIKALEMLVLHRSYDTRLMMMQRQGRISFYLEAKGEEAVSVGAGFAFHKEDVLLPYYRQQGLFLVRGASMVDMICHCQGNIRDNVKGRQMPIHYTFKQGHIISVSSPVATQFPQAVGVAMSMAYKGEDRIAAGWIGEGAAAEGDFHSALVFASVFKPPCVLNIVNNQWAISTPSTFAAGGRSFAARGLPYGIPGLRVDGNDLLAVYAATDWAAERARAGHGTTLIELVTYRAAGHSSSDDPSRYRAAGEDKCWPGGDPIRRLADHLIGLGEWSEEKQAELVARADAEVQVAYKEAEAIGTFQNGPHPAASSIFDDVYSELPWHLKAQRQEAGLG